MRRGLVWGTKLARSTCTAAVLVVAATIMAEDATDPVVSVFLLFWSQLLVGPQLFVCVLFFGLCVVNFGPLCCNVCC
ncbi:hypothetical protein EV1_005695 [Malus domestica]